VDRHRHEGVDVFVVDAESDDDVGTAVAAILALGKPVCLAGSIALAAALVPHLGASGRAERASSHGVPLPALIVSGSLHSRARAQVEAVLATGRAVAVTVPPREADSAALASVAAAAEATLASGTSVVMTLPAPASMPSADALRATEQALAELVGRIAGRVAIPTLVVIGGETSHAVLTRLGAGMIEVTGRIAPLIARGTIRQGTAAGSVVVTKGGSGGEPDVIAHLIRTGEG
jgi:uncharacterized protein YgbK (DUF1537 family)